MSVSFTLNSYYIFFVILTDYQRMKKKKQLTSILILTFY